MHLQDGYLTREWLTDVGYSPPLSLMYSIRRPVNRLDRFTRGIVPLSDLDDGANGYLSGRFHEAVPKTELNPCF